MAKTNFSGPITTGPIQVNTGTTIGTNVRDAAWVKNTMSFPFTYAQFAVTTDANRLAVTGSNGASTTDVTFVSDAVKANVSGITAVGGFQSASCITLNSSGRVPLNAITFSLTLLGSLRYKNFILSPENIFSYFLSILCSLKK